MRIPHALRRNVALVWRDDGERWLAGLPRTVAVLADDWELELGEPFDLSYHWVTRARVGGEEVVLKVGLPGSAHLTREAAALAAWAGSGAVRLLRADLDRGALLLERAKPGTPAAQLVPNGDERATKAAIGVLRRLHAAPDTGGLPTLVEQLAAFDEHLADPSRDTLVPRPWVERARGAARELLGDAWPVAVLHGDLHHDNVLRADREEWLAIDPHGVVGDPGYDTGAWLYNPLRSRDQALLALVPRRIEQLADGLGQPVERVVAWGFVKAVLSAVWTASDGGRPENLTLDVATLLLPRLG